MKHTVIFETETLSMTEGVERNGKKDVWLYDKTRKMNLSMRAGSEREAFIKTIEYYQERLLNVETELRQLQKHVDNFVKLINPESED